MQPASPVAARPPTDTGTKHHGVELRDVAGCSRPV